MPIQAIHGNERRHSMFVPITEGAIVGAGAGFVGKYLLPLTAEEKADEIYLERIADIENNKTAFNAVTKKYVNRIRTKANKSLAEDEFVKMFDGMKKGGKVKPSQIEQAIKNLEKLSPEQVPAFKSLCERSLGLAENLAKLKVQAYNVFTKHLTRPTGFFLVAGAVIGTFISVAHDLMKTEIKTLSDC